MNGPVRRKSMPSRLAIRAIKTYRSEISHRLHTHCNLDPSCSTFGLRAFQDNGFMRASAMTARRLAACRRARRKPAASALRRAAAALAATATTLLLSLLFVGMQSVPAGAYVGGPCTVSIAGRVVDTLDADHPITLQQHTQIRVVGRANTAVGDYSITLYFAGIDFAERRGPTTNRSWSDTVDIDKYATKGVGLYEVMFSVQAVPATSEPACWGYAYIKIEGNPLKTPVGAAAMAAEAVGLVGLLASSAAAGRGVDIPEGFTEIPPEDRLFNRPMPEGETDADRWARMQAEEQALQAKQREEKLIDDMKSSASSCTLLMVSAFFLTGFAMVAGPSGGAASPSSLPRARWRPRFSFVGIVGGFLSGVGGLVLLQQYAVLFPTRTVAIVFVAGGVILGITLPSLLRVRAVRKTNRRLARLR